MSPAMCLVRDGDYGVCNMLRDHPGVIHTERLPNGQIYAQWRSILPEDELDRADEYVLPDRRPNITDEEV